jgi:Ser/Thr protein kinase RdoA (MazF antagonist)
MMSLALSDAPILYLPRPGRISAYLRSRLRSLDIELGTVNEILGRYGLELSSTPRNLPNTRRNRNLIVETTIGKKILKLYRADWSPSTILFEHSILDQLANLDWPAPRLLRTTNDRTYVKHASKNYALFDFIEGKTYTSSFLLRSHRLHLMTLSGRTLASLHRHLKGFQPVEHHHHGFGNYSGLRHRDMAWHIKEVDVLTEASGQITNPQEKALAARLVEQSPMVLDRMGRLDHALSEVSLTRLIIHGDYGLHNLLFQSTERATPVDFELARIEWRLIDLVSCLSKLRYANGKYDFESMEQFMKGYQQEFPIEGQEWQRFPQVWQFYRLMGAVQYWRSYFATAGPVRKLHSALDSIEQANWATHHPQKILTINSEIQEVRHA